ncbi:MAG: GDSL-type esterase/lipase family protein, partial [Candidatus Methylomirabilales bacterium]
MFRLRSFAPAILFILLASACRIGGGPVSQAVTGIRYVALGDSFSSGDGIPGFGDTDTNENHCRRSIKAFPNQLTALLSWNPAALKNLACAGATVDELAVGRWRDASGIGLGGLAQREAAWHAPQQLEGATYPDVALVTITVGAADIGLPRLLEECGMSAASCVGSYLSVAGSIQGLEGSLDFLYRTTTDRFPKAKVIVVGYPRFVPPAKDSSPCPPTAGSYSPGPPGPPGMAGMAGMAGVAAVQQIASDLAIGVETLAGGQMGLHLDPGELLM